MTKHTSEMEIMEKFDLRALPGLVKTVQGMIGALALNRSEEDLIKDYGMLGIYNIRAVKESLTAIVKPA